MASSIDDIVGRAAVEHLSHSLFDIRHHHRVFSSSLLEASGADRVIILEPFFDIREGERTRALRIVYSSVNDSVGYCFDGRIVPGGRGLVSQALATKSRVYVKNNVSEEPNYFKYDDDYFDVKSEMVIPIIPYTNSSVVGLLVLQSSEEDFLNNRNIEPLISLQTQVLMRIIEASVDSMTKCFNRERFKYDLEHLLASIRDGIIDDFGYVLIDINGLKTVNDEKITGGYEKGNELLNSCSKILRERVYGASSVYRIGGDEFVILLQGFDENTTKNFVESLVNDALNVNNPIFPPVLFSAGGSSLKSAGNLENLKTTAENLVSAQKNLFYSKYPSWNKRR